MDTQRVFSYNRTNKPQKPLKLMRAKVVLSVLLLLGVINPLFAETNREAGDQYFKGYLLKNEAERLEKAGDILGAVQKYHEASQIITDVAHDYPGWQTQVINFRLKKIEEAILRLCAKGDLPLPVDPEPSKPTAPPATPSQPDLDALRRQSEELQKNLDELKSRVRDLDHARVAPLDPGILHP